MPKPVEPVNPTLTQDWLLLRQGLSRIVKYAAPNARVYERWPLKFEIGRTAELLKSPDDGGIIHSWIIGIREAVPYNDRAGDGRGLLWDLQVRIWGFIGYQYGVDSDNPQNTIEAECKKIAQAIYLNRNHLTLDYTQALKEVGFLEFRDIDAQGFGRDDIIVAQGEMNIKLIEVL